MYQKFIITHEGILRFGTVYMHKDLLHANERCEYGGGFWIKDEARNAILLYGRSFDFGPPSFQGLRRIEWSGIDGNTYPLFFIPNWPDENRLEPVFVHYY